MERQMNIAVVTNQPYVRYLYVMLTSLLESNKESNICIYLMSKDLTLEQLELYRELIERYGQKLQFLEIGTELFPEDLPVSDSFTIETYFRLALLDILPEEIERVLYLDTDIIVKGSLQELYDTDFDGKCFVACRDVAVTTQKNIEASPLFIEHSKNPEFTYFNAGVLLMNVCKLREHASLSFYLKEAERVKEHLAFCDQDLLNYLYVNEVKFVDEMKYNLFARTAYNSGYNYAWVDENVAILHYAGPKPWNYKELRYELERFWWDVAKETPFYTELMEEMLFCEIGSADKDELFRDLKRENDELRMIVEKCMALLKR